MTFFDILFLDQLVQMETSGILTSSVVLLQSYLLAKQFPICNLQPGQHEMVEINTPYGTAYIMA